MYKRFITERKNVAFFQRVSKNKRHKTASTLGIR